MLRAPRGVATVLLSILTLLVSLAGVALGQTTLLISVADTYLQKDTLNKKQGIETALCLQQNGSNCPLVGFDRAATKASMGSPIHGD